MIRLASDGVSREAGRQGARGEEGGVVAGEGVVWTCVAGETRKTKELGIFDWQKNSKVPIGSLVPYEQWPAEAYSSRGMAFPT